MHVGTQGDLFKFHVNHNVGKIDDAVGLFTGALRSVRRYSVNNTIPTLAVNAWVQFSLAYIAAIAITSNNLYFIKYVFDPKVMSVYALVSVIFGAILLASLAMKYMNKKEIKEESSIDVKIRGGKQGEISEIAEALRIEIRPDLSLIGYKRENFSIVLPISEEQSGILKNQEQENRNKIIILTIPYVISAAIIIGALVQSGLSLPKVPGNPEKSGLEELCVIAFVIIVVIVGTYTALSKLKNNEKNNKHDFVKRFDNLDILFPLRSGTVVSVKKGQIQDQEKTDPLSRLEKLLTNFKDEIVNSFDKHLDEATYLLDKKLLEPANANIEKTLDGIGENIQETLENLKKIREDIKTDLNVLHEEVSVVLNNAKEFTEKVNSLDIEDTFSNLQSVIKIAKDKIEQFQPSWVMGSFQQKQPDEFLSVLKKSREEVDELKKVSEELKTSLKEARTQTNKRDSGTSCDFESSANDSLNAQLAKEKQARQENILLKSKEKEEVLKKENAKLKENFAQQKETKEWKEKIYGPASEFFDYVLKSIKLENTEAEEGTNPTLRDFNNKIVIHWRDGSETTCYIDKQGDLQVEPNTTLNFVDPNIEAGFAVACAG